MDASNVTIVFCLDCICSRSTRSMPPATRTKATDLHAQFMRLRARRGPKKAICAVAASILTAAYHMLKDGTFYEDLGPVHFDRRRPETQARRLVKRLAELGFSVELKPAAAVS